MLPLALTLSIAFGVIFLPLARASVSSGGEFWTKLEQLVRWRKDAPFDAVFVGNSIPFCALDPEEVARASGGLRTYNASLSTLSLSAAQRWMQGFVAPMLRPRVVVIGLGGMEFNPHGALIKTTERSLRAQDLRARFYLAHPLKRAVLVCTRPELARFLLRRLVRGSTEVLPPGHDRSVVGPLGEERKHDDRSLVTTERLHLALRDGVFTNYEFCESEVDILREFVRAMRTHSEVVVLKQVTMPNAVDYYPRGEADYSHAWTRIRDVLDELAVPLIDVDPSPFDETCFADVMHMNLRGKTLYSHQVGVALATRHDLRHSRR